MSESNRTKELLPCPFCGGEAGVNTKRTTDAEYIRLNGRDHGYGVNCTTCGTDNRGVAMGYATREQAIAAWNRRDSLDAVLPCDVRLPPATTIRAGCSLSTLLHAMELRKEVGVVSFPPKAAPKESVVSILDPRRAASPTLARFPARQDAGT